MKKLTLLALMISLSVISANAATTTVAPTVEPLLLAPLSPTVLSQSYTGTTQDASGLQISTPTQQGVYEATYTPNLGENMVPQNAAAEGKPVPAKEEPRVKIQTKQRSQSNAYWNAGGKGTKSFF